MRAANSCNVDEYEMVGEGSEVPSASPVQSTARVNESG